MLAVNLKRNYRCISSIQQYYTGGPLVVTSDGLFLVCAYDCDIKVVDSSNASIKYTLEGDGEAITALAISPDGKFLFSVSHSRQVRVWDFLSSKCLRSWKAHDGPVMKMACDSSGGLLATGGADMKVLVWDVDGGYCTHFFKGHKRLITCLMFHPDSNRLFLFSGSDDGDVRVWDLVSKQCIAALKKHYSAVTSLAISENGWTLLSAGRDQVVNLWDLRNYAIKMTVITNEVLESVCVIDPMSTCLGHLLPEEETGGGSLQIYFLTAGEHGILRIWSSKGARCIYEQKQSDATIYSVENDERRGFKFAFLLPAEQGVLCVTADQQFLFYLPFHSAGHKVSLILNKRLVGYNEEVVDLKFLDEDERFLAVATNLEEVRVYDLTTMSCTHVLVGHSDTVLCLDTCVSGSGRVLLVTGSKDKTVRVWDDKSRSCIGVGTGHTGAVGAVAFSKRKKNFVVSGSCDRTLKLWSVEGVPQEACETAQLRTRAIVAAHDKDINSVAISPDDTLVCSGSQDRTACIWRLPTLASVQTLRGHRRGIWSVEFSPVDKCVITSSADRTIRIWEVPSGTCLRTFEGHTSSVLRALFVTRGTQFISCGADGLVKLWTVKSNECIATYDSHDDKIWALAVGAKTEMLATGGGDGIVNLWHDWTVADKEEAVRREEEGVLKSQELDNAVSETNYAKAVHLAFELRKPNQLFNLLSRLCRAGNAEDKVDKVIGSLGKEEILLLLEYIREWNTKPKLCHVAQFTLFRVFNLVSPCELLKIRGMTELLEGLIPYSQRHFSRIDRLARSTYLLDYALTGMSVLEPESDITSAETEPWSCPKEITSSSITEENLVPPEAKADYAASEASSRKQRSSSSREGKRRKLKATPLSGSLAISQQA